MKCRQYHITVNGCIVAKSGSHYAQGWGACGISSLSDHFDEKEFPDQVYSFNETTHTIDGNLILNKNSRLIPYATYTAKGGLLDFTSCGILPIMEGITYLPGYEPAVRYYDNTITEISHLLSIKTDPIAEEAYIRGLYVSVFGTFELFLRDFLLCGIFNYDDCYSRAVEYFKNKYKNKYKLYDSYDQYEHMICDEINCATFHNFSGVNELFISLNSATFFVKNCQTA